jgi:ribosomal protein S27AE
MDKDPDNTRPDETVRPLGSQREREYSSGGYSTYYLKDRPVLVPVLTLVIGGLCIYATVFSNLLRDVMVGSGASRSVLDGFYTATSWGIAFVLGIMVIALVYLVVHFTDLGIRRLRRRPAVCPRCGTAEAPRTLPFAHEPIKDTDWENVTCPNCGTTWHGRR